MDNDFITIYLKGVEDGKDKKKQEIDMLERKLYDYEQENEQLKEEKRKVIEFIKEHQRKDEFLNLNEWQTRDLLEILGEEY